MAVKLDSLYYQIEARTEGLGPGLAAAERRLQRFAGLIKAHPVAALGALASVAVLVGMEATRMAARFDEAMRRVTALLPEASGKLDILKKQVIDLSKRLPFTADQLAGALRTVVEVGGREMREPTVAIQRLDLAAQGALASGSDLATVARTLDDVMDAFGLSGNAAAQTVLDLMVAAHHAGVQFGDLSGFIAKVAPAAAAAGVPMDRLVASIITLSEMGLQGRDMASSLRAALLGIKNETEVTGPLLQRFGITVTGTGASFALGGAAAGRFADAVREVAHAQGAAARSAAEAQAGAAAQLQQSKNIINGVLLDIGAQVVEGISSWIMYWRAVNGRDPVTGAKMEWHRPFDAGRAVAVLGRPMTPAQRAAQGYIAGGGTGNIPAGEPPDRAAALRLAEEQGRLLEQLRTQLASLTRTGLDEALLALDRLERAFHEKFGDQIPAEAEQGFARIRAAAREGADLQQFADEIAAVKDQLDELAASGQAGTQQFRDQVAETARIKGNLEAYVGTLHESEGSQRRGVELLRDIERLQRQVAEHERDALKDARGKADAKTRETRDLRTQALLVERTARRALQLADAFGIVNSETRATLESLVEIGAGIKPLLDVLKGGKGGVGGILTAALPVLGGVASLVGSLFGGGESAEERALRAAQVEELRKNSEVIQELTRQIGNSSLNITGRQFAGVSQAARGALESAHGSDLGMMLKTLPTALAFAGVSMQDLRHVAEELHITIAGTIPTITELQQIVAALDSAELDQLANTFAGQMELLRRTFDAFDITDPIEQLTRLQAAIGGLDEGALSAIQGLDLTTAEGRAQAEAILRNLFQQATSGGLTPAQIGALFGGLTPTEFLDAIAALQAAIDAANGAAGGTTETVGMNRSITEVTGSRIGAILSTIAYQDERTAIAAEYIARLLESASRPVSVQPPTQAEMDRFMGRGTGAGRSITIQIGPINVTGPMSAGEAQQVGYNVGLAAAEVMNRQLGALAARRRAALGDVTLQ
jgi:phage-related minor tail protein